MLEAYFDDSGTHNGSRVVVWGGLVGHAQSFAHLDAEWQRLLACPDPQLKPLKAFHLYSCVHRTGEFEGYTQGASDLVRSRFRTAIIESGVAAVACGVDIREWDHQVTGHLRELVGGAERCAFGLCVKLSVEMAGSENEQLNAHFDRAREGYVLNVIEGARLLYPDANHLFGTSFCPVNAYTGLQAADTVAYESYAFLRDMLSSEKSDPGPHLRHLIASAESTTIMLMGRDEIANLVEKMQSAVGEYRQ
ncbi:hypothetical protein [Sphingosinicella sp. BN140058]|uniref:hypothetical protein n=1 Tax=Sphingosinicella sp. BN140058 TaxID=1892855 RepID=UPI0010135193|nr:hypothetical protein [Sphingosinicella sp. BN140058]QAY75144.1 hypothetical protein ETR14_00315 [Sphingosinicella sp. BN140058]